MFLRDPRAATLFTNSYAGALRSYWAALVILPLYILAVGVRSGVINDSSSFATLSEQSGVLGATLAHFCIYVLCWFVAWPLVLDRVAGYLDCSENYFRYVAAYNWMHILHALISLLFVTGALAGVVHNGNSFVASLSLLAVLWTYHWFILRHALGINGGFAALLVGLEFVCVTMLKEIITNVAM